MIDKRIARKHQATFEAIRHTDEDGSEFWTARELAEVLDYSQYRHFVPVIERAHAACRASGRKVADHFEDVLIMVDIGSGARREIEDVYLSRYACYLIVQNGDPSKPVIALGQTYFAIQTRRQELADDARFAALPEDDKRLAIRNELAQHNKHLAAAAKDSGVVTSLDYAIFQDHGYKGLYGGMAAKDIHARKGLKKSQKILDHMGSAELAANLFRATQTDKKLRRDKVRGKQRANQTHKDVGRKAESASYGRRQARNRLRLWTITDRGRMMFKHGMRPIHPGEVLREDYLAELDVSVNALAKALRVPTTRINDIVLERRGVTADTALRLARYFGGDAQSWLNLQSSYELRVSEQAVGRKIEREVRSRVA